MSAASESMARGVAHQQAIRARCSHPSGAFVAFPKEELEQSIGARFERQVQEYPERLAGRTRTETYTYAGLNETANRVADALLRLRGHGQEPVALLFDNGASFVVASLGVLKAGKIQVPLESGFPRARLRYMLEDSQPAVLVTDNTNLPLAQAFAPPVLINIEEVDARFSSANPGLTPAPDSYVAVGRPDPALTQLPYRYFKLEDDIVPILSGPGGDPVGQYLPGFVYVSYVDRVEDNGVYYMLPNGGWIPGKGSRIGEYSSFQGLEFDKTPVNSFAWPLPFYTDKVPVHTAPGFNTPLTDRVLYPYVNLVQVYDTKTADGVEWNMIGHGEWVEARILATVTPNTTPPEGVTNGRWIDVNLAEQTLAVYDNNQLIFATVIATGLSPY